MTRKKPVGIIVRRGAVRRFDALVRKTADLPVEVSWDRRSEDRREPRESSSIEGRSSDRRKTPPFTWEVADFVVVEGAREAEAPGDHPATPTQKTKKAKKTAKRL